MLLVLPERVDLDLVYAEAGDVHPWVPQLEKALSRLSGLPCLKQPNVYRSPELHRVFADEDRRESTAAAAAAAR